MKKAKAGSLGNKRMNALAEETAELRTESKKKAKAACRFRNDVGWFTHRARTVKQWFRALTDGSTKVQPAELGADIDPALGDKAFFGIPTELAKECRACGLKTTRTSGDSE